MTRILHVEDDPDIREIAKMALENIGNFEVVQCESGEQAISVAEKLAPDILLLDMMMPGMSGQTTLEHLRTIKGLAETPAIFMTARAQPSEIQAFKNAGALGVIVKPFDPITLAQQINDLVAAR